MKKGFVPRSPKALPGKRARRTQRYFCKECGKSFSLRKDIRLRHSRDFINEAVTRYVEDNTSFRNVARRMKVSRTTVLKWVAEAGRACKGTIETDLELKPCWSGVLCVDGKPVAVAGEKDTALVAVDKKSKDLVHLRVVDEENEEGFMNFLLEIRDVIKYPLTGLVSDLGKGRVLVKLIARLFPNVPHQLCVVHFSRYIDFILPKSKKSMHYKENTGLRQMINGILFAPSLQEADYFYNHLLQDRYLFKTDYQKAVIRSTVSHYALLTKHFYYPYLPRDNNVAEGLIKQLNKKLKLAEGYLTKETAYNHLKLWALCYRFKPFSDSRTQQNNGKSPLQLAQVDTSNANWLGFSNATKRPI